jgi:anti-sigma factor RsiW
MASCKEIEPLVTPYVDGEVGAADRTIVAAHLERCPSCRLQAEREAAARIVVRARARVLVAPPPPAGLRARCAAHAQASARPTAWRPLPWAVAALAGAAAILLVTLTSRSATVLAAQLTVDHIKCFEFVGENGGDAHVLEAKLENRFGWHLIVPPGSPAAGLKLLTARRCFYADGKVAHLMYRHHDRPVSLFVLPDTTRVPDELRLMGHQVVMWSSNRRSYVLIGRESRADLEQLAAYVKTSLDPTGIPRR